MNATIFQGVFKELLLQPNIMFSFEFGEISLLAKLPLNCYIYKYIYMDTVFFFPLFAPAAAVKTYRL